MFLPLNSTKWHIFKHFTRSYWLNRIFSNLHLEILPISWVWRCYFDKYFNVVYNVDVRVTLHVYVYASFHNWFVVKTLRIHSCNPCYSQSGCEHISALTPWVSCSHGLTSLSCTLFTQTVLPIFFLSASLRSSYWTSPWWKWMCHSSFCAWLPSLNSVLWSHPHCHQWHKSFPFQPHKYGNC